jgi:hypothetical protein
MDEADDTLPLGFVGSIHIEHLKRTCTGQIGNVQDLDRHDDKEFRTVGQGHNSNEREDFIIAAGIQSHKDNDTSLGANRGLGAAESARVGRTYTLPQGKI